MNDEHAATLLAEKFGPASEQTPAQPTPSMSHSQPTPTTSLPPSAARNAMVVDSGAPVQAYAKLEGPEICYYIRSLQTVLGRRTNAHDLVDVDLGRVKAISREHARISYNFASARFEISVLGKNGILINDGYVPHGSNVVLTHHTKIQIAHVYFMFLLPKVPARVASQDSTHGIPPSLSTPSKFANPSLHPASLTATPHGTVIPSSHPRLQPSPHPSMLQSPLASQGPRPIRQAKLPSVQPSPGTVHMPYTPSTPPQSEQRANCDDGEIDYTKSDKKPHFSYASLIAQAINSTEEKKITLNGIYNYIASTYPYYQLTKNGWQNSIRHNLSLNKAFVKVQRADNEPGKGAYWAIEKEYQSMFANGVYKRSRRTHASKAAKRNREMTTPYSPPNRNMQKLSLSPLQSRPQIGGTPKQYNGTTVTTPATAPPATSALDRTSSAGAVGSASQVPELGTPSRLPPVLPKPSPPTAPPTTLTQHPSPPPSTTQPSPPSQASSPDQQSSDDSSSQSQ
ncbi:hypothetical protein H4R34_001375 [Dimargaris verticillata]|uniref:Fork head domain-containing protein n=1 Tax=Dimargaris verticillata TaxID=2761393 RepID=A0A9W8B4L1_9FUNG|nr:hypothetical protein H4R34_001375 [Dimargaris verticillata]